MGERFGKYELVQRIGVGGMAEVWMARTFGAQGFVKELVIKRILEQFNEDPDFVSMFINEARLAARLQHANIVQIYDFDNEDGVYFIAMEFVDGQDLRRVQATARRRKLAASQTLAVHVGVEALKGLHYAHTRSEHGRALGIVHRDISPHNLLLSYAGEVKIADFGIAKVAALASATRTGMVKGKLTYMSPEQVRGDTVDQRADLYALGIVLWELLAGRRLYGAVGSEGELVAAARRGTVPPLSGVAQNVPPALCGVVDRMLSPDVDQRFSSSADALAELSAFAGATDSLEVSDYLRRLLPGGGERQERGMTAVEQLGSVAVAAPDAPTGTVDEVGRDPNVVQAGAAEAIPAPNDSGELAHPPHVGSQPSGARRPWVGLAALAVGVFALATLAAWWGVGRQAPAWPRAGRVSIAAPFGATVEVDGVPLVGDGPALFFAPRGRHLQLVARRGSRSIRREYVAGKAGRVALAWPKEPPRSTAVAVDAHGSRAGEDAGVSRTVGARPAVVNKPKEPANRPKGNGLKGGHGAAKPPHRSPDARHPKHSGQRSSTGSRAHAALPKDPRKRARDPRKSNSRPKAGTGKAAGHRRPPRAFGVLRVVVSPAWGNVFVDGKKWGPTPVKRELPVGRHRLYVVNPELAKRHRTIVEIKAGKVAAVRLHWGR